MRGHTKRKLLLFLVLFGSVMGSGFSHAAMPPDAATYGPEGEVILFYKDGNEIVIQNCEDHTILNQRSDCRTKAGTVVSRVLVNEFKNRLKFALKIPANYADLMKFKIDLYNKKNPKELAELSRQYDEINRAIDQIQDFIKTYGPKNADLVRLQELRAKKDTLSSIPEIQNAIREINRLIDRLVDQTIGSPRLHKFIYSKDGRSFAFNILRTYTKNPGLFSKFIPLKAARFMMGSSADESYRFSVSDEVQHPVTLTKDFELQETELTQAQWVMVMGYNHSWFQTKEICPKSFTVLNGVPVCPQHPVENMTGPEVADFIKRLNEMVDDGYVYRLPTEAEWEYAARGGSSTPYFFGDDYRLYDEYMWSSENSYQHTHEVGLKKPNAYGFYDMIGNVSERVLDFYKRDYEKLPEQDPLAGFEPGTTGIVTRGGNWIGSAWTMRTAERSMAKIYWLGFRVLRMKKN